MTQLHQEFTTGRMAPPVILRGKNPQDQMSALGQKQTFGIVQSMSALPPKADIGTYSRNVCFVPILLQKGVEGLLGQ
jgi:hypothetical protein